MKLSHVLVAVTFLGILAMATHVSIDSDTWWHLRAGQYMVENGQLISEDVFSYTSYGKAWQYPGLWVQVFMYGLFAWFGPGGLNLWVSLTITLIFVIVWKTTRGNVLLRSFVVLLAAISSAIYWSARPYLLTYLLFALSFYILEKFYYDQKKLWLLPVLMVIWVNSHGGFLAGFLLMLPYIVDLFYQWLSAKRNGDQAAQDARASMLKHLLIAFGLTLAASFISPQGAKLWLLPFSTVSRQAEQLFIAEWQSPDFHNVYLLPFALMVFLGMVAIGRSEKKAKLYEVFAIGGFGLLGLISVRNIFFFAIVAPAFIAKYGGYALGELGDDLNLAPKLDFSESPNKTGKTINAILVAAVALISLMRIAIYIPSATNQKELSQIFPIEAVEYLKTTQLSGQIFNSYNYGGYLIWALPNHPVFVDGRADLHQDEIILTWYRVKNGGEEWKSVFDQWGIEYVILEPDTPLLAVLEDDGWTEVYRDDVAVISASGAHTQD